MLAMLKWTAKLAAGCPLDELKNDITRETPARPVRASIELSRLRRSLTG